MIQRLHVLIVEDSEKDAELLLHALKHNGYELTHNRVQTASEMDAALKEKKWDLVLADYTMPRFNGREALDLLRQMGLDIPFITVSGSLGEDIAVEMMKAGAGDYIMKNNLARLVPAIQRELEAAEARRARKRAEEASQYLAAIVESSEDAIYGNTLDGVIVSWNRAAEKIYGYTTDEMIGQSVLTLFPPDRVAESQEIIDRIRRGERVGGHETVHVRKDQKLISISLTISPIKDNEGNIVGASAIARDITERKRDEEERIRLIAELTDALSHVQVLTGLLPICAACKKIRDDGGYWEQVETYFEKHTQAQFTHGICPDCMERLYPEYKDRIKK